MGKTKRNASRWMETRFKLGDTQYPEENETHYFNGRYQAKMRNGNHSYHTEKIDPLSYKVASWKDYGRDMKVLAKRRARHNAKLLIIKLTKEILMEIQMDLEDQLIDDDWYEKGMMEIEDWHNDMCFDIRYSDEAYDYAERRRQEELEDDYLDYGYGLYEDWDY